MSATHEDADMPNRFKHPFTESQGWVYYRPDDDDPADKDTPLTLIEIRMCALSAAIREKPEWWVKFRDEAIRAKWREEIKEQQKDLHRSLQLTDDMVRVFDAIAWREHSLSMHLKLNYIIGELEAYAALRDPETGIEVCRPIAAGTMRALPLIFCA